MRQFMLAVCVLPLTLMAEESEITVIQELPMTKETEVVSQAKPYKIDKNYKAFTGKVNGNKVRLRVSADLESPIVAELAKDDLVIVKGQKGDFYAVEPLAGQRAYIFRSFVLDGQVEGSRVNVRLQPSIDAPIIGHLSTGFKVAGRICKDNHKWLEIPTPEDTAFYVAKEYLANVGSPDVKLTHDKRSATVNQLFDSANLLVQAEMRKPYTAIDIEQLTRNYQTIVNDYNDFPEHASKAKKALSQLQEDYLQKKIAYLEAKAQGIENPEEAMTALHEAKKEELNQVTDRMKNWETVEESLYLTWSGHHHAKTMDDYYAVQKKNPVLLSGIVESFSEAVKCVPGDYTLQQNGVPVAYLYSTNVNLQALVGKKVNLVAAERPNNSFAFPAYFVLDAE